MRVIPVPVRSDNYAYLLVDDEAKEAVAIDIYDVSKVTSKAKEEGVTITSLLTTHHHHDHAGGNVEYVESNPVKVFGGSTKVAALTDQVKDGDVLRVGKNVNIKCMATPCHTQDSICYYVTDDKVPEQRGVFTGDTLFTGGCGRFFEGTAQEMHKALSYLGTLPDDTVTYPGHEYTKSNFKFCAHIDPDNVDIQRGSKLAADNSITTGLTTIGDEKKFNVFMRLDSASVMKATGASTTSEVMDKLRTMKNNF